MPYRSPLTLLTRCRIRLASSFVRNACFASHLSAWTSDEPDLSGLDLSGNVTENLSESVNV